MLKENNKEGVLITKDCYLIQYYMRFDYLYAQYYVRCDYLLSRYYVQFNYMLARYYSVRYDSIEIELFNCFKMLIVLDSTV